LSHPGIVVVHDVGQDPESGILYIALEYLAGRTLAQVIAEGKPLEWREALRITKGVAEALHHAHSEGVVHRDVKPANIMILDSGEPKIMDFGIAKVEASQLTAAGQFFGTPLYMSPEQALGRPLDARSDLFSLGALTYGLLTGQQAFAGAAVPHIITRVLQDDPVPPCQLVPTLPPDLDYFVGRALAKEPEDRYPSGMVMAEDADDILSSRQPRHRGAWNGAGRAEGTLVARVRPAPERPKAEPPATVKPAARPARQGARPWAALVVAALLGAAAVSIGLQALRKRGESGSTVAARRPAAREAATRESLPPTTTREAVPEFPAESEPAEFGEAPAPEPAFLLPVPPPTIAPQAPAVAAPDEGAESPAELLIDFEHTLEDGTLRVWVDGALVVETGLDSRVTKKIVALELRKGNVEQTLELSPGLHEVKVQVSWEDNVKTKHIFGRFKGGATRRLSAKLGGGLKGFVKKDLKLEWE
jgi:eukaryotic-like serine/threonine-protein kinase